MRHTWHLPNGRFATVRDDTWTLWDSPGHVLFVGDAEGLLAYLTARGWAA